MQKQLLWNLRINTNEQNVRYIFAIINDSREAKALKSRLIGALAPVEEISEREGSANKTHYHLLAFTSHKKIEGLNRIYRGKTKKDERLYERTLTGIDGLEAYIESQLQN